MFDHPTLWQFLWFVVAGFGWGVGGAIASTVTSWLKRP